jgi:hypothetical protein
MTEEQKRVFDKAITSINLKEYALDKLLDHNWDWRSVSTLRRQLQRIGKAADALVMAVDAAEEALPPVKRRKPR